MLTDRLYQARGAVERLHRGQFCKETTVPYIAILLAVAALVLEHGGDEQNAILLRSYGAIEDRAVEAGDPDALRAHLRETNGEQVLADGRSMHRCRDLAKAAVAGALGGSPRSPARRRAGDPVDRCR